ncbi:hypothetical protein [Rickettsia rickettsii]|uniref:Proline/betaine transporter n=1 Tax=Rickettsia rickettsii (strain Iowa) TaxID=452659 RepID=B0BYD2_RICRO|nr:hypothetical protein [Rickettsia rickettsii]ABY72858.1 proline/betaine transporter [Rickettsia rickettsii str. Iowa]AFB25174.1 proline/betaine transporter [Rickettsia rickettsii str. Arizona]AFB27854.1 proline/betaine transporter [Rickettsia rickettsii str. Hino]AFB30514.1 proline/betaine transporter [Rickettsia rickettsii str. Hauke]APU55808.1 proline/betaine transporter [Rickettsia rickettsii]
MVVLISSILLNNISNTIELLLFQLFIVVFVPTTFPAGAVFYARFPVLKRFTCGSFIFALSRALMFAVSSFRTIYLIDSFNHWGLLFLIIPILIGYTFGVNHFIKLEEEAESYY